MAFDRVADGGTNEPAIVWPLACNVVGMHDSITITRKLSLLFTAASLGALTLLAACQGSNEVLGSVDVDLRSETLLQADLESANGTYGAGCTNRTGSWSVEIAAGATLDHDELSVVKNNAACVLTLTELRTSDGAIAADPSISLTTSYKVAASAFDDLFYANARLSSVSFAADFTLTILYADDPDSATDDNTAKFDVVESSAMGDSVTVPDYAIEPDDLDVIVDEDQIVQAASGGVTLTAGAQTGQTFVVADAAGLDTYAELDAAYLAGTPAAIGASIPASAFTLVAEDLDDLPIRTLILANIENGVASYQSFEITFHPAVVI